MKITLLGTGGALPDANRAGPATLVQTRDTNILVDAGRGVLMRLTASTTATGRSSWQVTASRPIRSTNSAPTPTPMRRPCFAVT